MQTCQHVAAEAIQCCIYATVNNAVCQVACMQIVLYGFFSNGRLFVQPGMRVLVIGFLPRDVHYHLLARR